MTGRACTRHGASLAAPRQRKLCERCRAEIRTRHAAGASLHHLAGCYGVCINTIWRVCRNIPPAPSPSLAPRIAAVRALAARQEASTDSAGAR